MRSSTTRTPTAPARYLDHQTHRVTYASTEVGRSAVPTKATEVVTVRVTDDLAEVTSAVDGLALRHGAPDRIVALKEDDLLVGAALREKWAVPVGPVEKSDLAINEFVAELALRVMCALSDLALVFHLEMFFDAETGDRAFLEVGARVSGAEMPLLWREVHGHDLMETAFRIQLGLGVRAQTPHLTPEIGGWLLAPAPAPAPAHRPCRIAETTPMVGRDPGPYAEVLLKVGEILPDADSYYEHVGGRFRFRGSSTQAVETGVRGIAADFRVSGQPVA